MFGRSIKPQFLRAHEGIWLLLSRGTKTLKYTKGPPGSPAGSWYNARYIALCKLQLSQPPKRFSLLKCQELLTRLPLDSLHRKCTVSIPNGNYLVRTLVRCPDRFGILFGHLSPSLQDH